MSINFIFGEVGAMPAWTTKDMITTEPQLSVIYPRDPSDARGDIKEAARTRSY